MNPIELSSPQPTYYDVSWQAWVEREREFIWNTLKEDERRGEIYDCEMWARDFGSISYNGMSFPGESRCEKSLAVCWKMENSLPLSFLQLRALSHFITEYISILAPYL